MVLDINLTRRFFYLRIWLENLFILLNRFCKTPSGRDDDVPMVTESAKNLLHKLDVISHFSTLMLPVLCWTGPHSALTDKVTITGTALLHLESLSVASITSKPIPPFLLFFFFFFAIFSFLLQMREILPNRPQTHCLTQCSSLILTSALCVCFRAASWPGHGCKWEMVFNWSSVLNQG